MGSNPIISPQKIQQAAGGNAALLEILQQMNQSSQLSQTVTKTGTGKPIPAQAKASVSYLQSNYIVQIQNPGTSSALSAIQSAQATAGATVQSNVANVTPIYHQIRVASSPNFNISSNVQVFGGDTGSTQTYWTISNLGSGRFYFQIRSSYDGVNWNLWRNANGGQTITQGVSGVTTEAVANAVWGAFTLPGDQLVAFGSGFVANGGSFAAANSLYTSAMQVIPGPNGFTQTGNLAHGILANSVSIVTPNPVPSLIGPADFPTLVAETYQDGEGNTWPGSANIFGFCYDPLGSNVSYYPASTGGWAVFTLPGGAQMAVGSGVVTNGNPLVIPAAMQAWFNPNNMVSVVSPNNALSSGNHAHGINQAAIVPSGPGIGAPAIVHATFEDGEGNIWGGTANWFAVAFSPGLNFTEVAGGRFMEIDLPSGGAIGIGSGTSASQTPFGLPEGFTTQNTLSFGTPASFQDIGDAMGGVASCDVQGTTPVLAYQDGAYDFWSGNVAWMCFCWR